MTVKTKRKYIVYSIIIISTIVLMALINLAENEVLDLMGANIFGLAIVVIVFRESKNVKSREVPKGIWRLRWLFPTVLWTAPKFVMDFIVSLILFGMLLINILFFAGVL